MEKKYGNKYEVACAILEKLEQGGSGGGGGDVALVDGTKFTRSTFTEIPEYYDFSEITDFKEMFYDCDNLTTVGSLDFSSGTNKFNSMFGRCDNLTTVGNLDMSNGLTFNDMFYDCDNLTTVGNLKTSSGVDFYAMFADCSNLTTVGSLDFSNALYWSSLFSVFENCSKLENITLVGYVNKELGISYSPNLTYDSIKSILTACSKTTNTSSKTLRFNRTIADNNGELIALVGECTTKGWTITGLTLE